MALAQSQKEITGCCRALFPASGVAFGCFFACLSPSRWRWIRRILAMAVDPISMQATRNWPLTGSLPAGKGCLTLRTVASTAARKLRPSCRCSQLRRRRSAACVWAVVKRRRRPGRRFPGRAGHFSTSGQV